MSAFASAGEWRWLVSDAGWPSAPNTARRADLAVKAMSAQQARRPAVGCTSGSRRSSPGSQGCRTLGTALLPGRLPRPGQVRGSPRCRLRSARIGRATPLAGTGQNSWSSPRWLTAPPLAGTGLGEHRINTGRVRVVVSAKLADELAAQHVQVTDDLVDHLNRTVPRLDRVGAALPKRRDACLAVLRDGVAEVVPRADADAEQAHLVLKRPGDHSPVPVIALPRSGARRPAPGRWSSHSPAGCAPPTLT